LPATWQNRTGPRRRPWSDGGEHWLIRKPDRLIRSRGLIDIPLPQEVSLLPQTWPSAHRHRADRVSAVGAIWRFVHHRPRQSIPARGAPRTGWNASDP
jgi:hypothetical protein